MRRKKILAGVLLLLGAVTVIGFAPADDDGPDIRTESVQRRDLFSTVSGSGRIHPKRKVDISADLSGRVIELAVQEGQWVKEGDLLLRIDPTRYHAAVYRAQAGVAQAKAAVQQVRANRLHAQSALRRMEEIAASSGLVSGAEMEQARTQAAVVEAQAQAAQYGVEQAEASLSEAREVLEKTIIRAPMGGRITRLNIREGETSVVGTMNNPGSLLLTIADLSAMEVFITVDETDVPRITVGDSATVRIDAFPRETFRGRVARISNSAVRGGGQESANYQVVVALSQPTEAMRPDLSASAEILTDAKLNALSVPILALTVRSRAGKDTGPAAAQRSGGEAPRRERQVEGVFVVRDGTARFVPVEVGIAGDRYFEVKRGLKGGEVVVSGTYQGIRELKDGAELDLESLEAGRTAKDER